MPYNTHKHYRLFNRLNNESKLQQILNSGLNNLKYEILDRKTLHPIVELIILGFCSHVGLPSLVYDLPDTKMNAA